MRHGPFGIGWGSIADDMLHDAMCLSSNVIQMRYGEKGCDEEEGKEEQLEEEEKSGVSFGSRLFCLSQLSPRQLLNSFSAASWMNQGTAKTI